MEDKHPSILKDNSLITQPNQEIQQVEQTISPFLPSFSPPPPFLFLSPSSPSPSNQQVVRVEQTISPPIFPSSILTNNSFILQPTLALPFPPYPLPPPASPTPPLPPVIRDPILITPKPFIFNEGPATYILPDRQSREIANYKFKIYDTDDSYDSYDPFDPHIEENLVKFYIKIQN
jgi:hypothetical protein